MSILLDITVVLALAAVVLFVCIRLKIPTIVAFLFAGMLAGPHGLGLVRSAHEVESLAEVGVLLLLFTIGIEFSLEKLISSKKYILLGGSSQMILTIATFFVLTFLLGYPWNQALFLGFLFSLSSTAIVLQLFQDSNQIESFHGRVSLSILIFQDIAIVPLILVLPWISGKGFELYDLMILFFGIIIVTAVLIGSRKIMPRLIHSVVNTRNRELFLLFIIVVCFLTALVTYQIGLSLALGAFLAGLVISESEFSFEAMSNILPLKKIFTSIFFISVGMLLDIGILIEKPFQVMGFTVGVMFVKIIIVMMVGWVMQLPRRSMWITALALCQVGEFAFVLSQQGASYQLLDGELSQIFLAVSVISMGLSPFLIQASPRIAALLMRTPLEKIADSANNSGNNEHGVNLKDHIVIVGFGINGRNVARAAKAANIPHVIIDFNPDTYRKEKLRRENFIYGDATTHDTLQRANIAAARIAIVATHDPIATEMIVAAIRRSSEARIIVRARFMTDIEILRKLGADEVIPEEFETSIEIFTRVMKHYLVPDNEIDAFTNDIRKESYEMMRRQVAGKQEWDEISFVSKMEVVRLKIHDSSSWSGRSIKEINLRKEFGINVLAIERMGAHIHNPDSSFVLMAEDVLAVIGLPSDITRVRQFAQSI